MTDCHELSDETRRDIESLVRSTAELDVLLLLGREPARCWSSVAAATVLGMPEPAVTGSMEALASRNLLDVRMGEHVLYRLNPTGQMRAAVDRILAAGWRSHSAVRSVIGSLAGRSVLSPAPGDGRPEQV